VIASLEISSLEYVQMSSAALCLSVMPVGDTLVYNAILFCFMSEPSMIGASVSMGLSSMEFALNWRDALPLTYIMDRWSAYSAILQLTFRASRMPVGIVFARRTTIFKEQHV
jgi:hypothetical protein